MPATGPPQDGSPAPVPARPSLSSLRQAAQRCRACELWEGSPFVGPAGGILGRGLELAEIDRGDVFVTNVVKHFRYKARGKRRIHQRPDRSHVAACRPWFDAELKLVHPEALVCLGATAGQALLGPQVRIGRDRGRRLESDLAELVTLTTHPSAILRVREDSARKAAMEQFVSDLAAVADWLRNGSGR